MTKSKFKDILKLSLEENALHYLKNKQKSKGKEIQCSCMKMAEYMTPSNEKLSITEKQNLFSVRNRMFKIP